MIVRNDWSGLPNLKAHSTLAKKEKNMKRILILGAVVVLWMATAGTATAYQYSLPTSSELYNINWAVHMVDGTGYIPSSSDPDPTDGYYYSSWQDPTDPRDDGTFALGTPDMVYGDPEGVYEMWGGASGFSPKNAADSWFVLGFDAPLTNMAGNDMQVYQLGWGGDGTEILVSTDSVYTSVEAMTWISLGMLDLTSKPFTWGDYGTAPSMFFDFSDYGLTDDVNYVMFEGNGHWIDAVGAVPIPGAVWLLGSGLLALVGIRRRTT
jgi:hypothetical protein